MEGNPLSRDHRRRRYRQGSDWRSYLRADPGGICCARYSSRSGISIRWFLENRTVREGRGRQVIQRRRSGASKEAGYVEDQPSQREIRQAGKDAEPHELVLQYQRHRTAAYSVNHRASLVGLQVAEGAHDEREGCTLRGEIARP